MILFTFLAITLVAFPSEACPSTPAPATPAPTPAPTPVATTAPKYECPIGGETSKGVTCIGGGNVEAIEPNVENVIDCSKY